MRRAPLLSILVATRNRQPYAFELVDDVLAWADDRVEIVVEDNSEDTSLAERLEPYRCDARLRYRYNADAISSIDNFNNVLAASNGHYVCLIGDDDGVSSMAIRAVEWANRHDVDCIMGSVAHEYIWPARAESALAKPGMLSLPEFSGRLTVRSGKMDLQPFLSRGGSRYLDLGFPRLYHGFVRRSILARMHELRGYYLGGLSPDIYSAVSLSQLADKVASVDYPLTIPGVCPASTTATEGKGAAFSRNVRNAPHFRCRDWYQFSPIIPPLYCVDTIWADSACAALKDLGRPELCDQLDLAALAAYIFRNQPRLTEPLLDWMVESGHADSRLSAQAQILKKYLGQPLRSDVRRAIRKVARLIGRNDMARVKGLRSIADARQVVETSVRTIDLDKSVDVATSR